MDGLLLQMDGLLLQMDGLLLQMDGLLLQMDGLLLQMDGLLAWLPIQKGFPVDQLILEITNRLISSHSIRVGTWVVSGED